MTNNITIPKNTVTKIIDTPSGASTVSGNLFAVHIRIIFDSSTFNSSLVMATIADSDATSYGDSWYSTELSAKNNITRPIISEFLFAGSINKIAVFAEHGLDYTIKALQYSWLRAYKLY